MVVCVLVVMGVDQVPLMGPMRPNVLMGLAIHMLVMMVVVYDIWALTYHDETWTVTYIIQDWSRDHPVLPFITGMVMGHLFFSVHRIGQ